MCVPFDSTSPTPRSRVALRVERLSDGSGWALSTVSSPATVTAIHIGDIVVRMNPTRITPGQPLVLANVNDATYAALSSLTRGDIYATCME